MEELKEKVSAFKFWETYYDVAQELTPKEQGEYYRAIMAYMFEGADREAELSKAVRIAFKAVKGNLNRSKSNKRVSYDEDGNASGANRDGNGKESRRNRKQLRELENALTLTLTSTSTSSPNETRSDAGAVGGGEAPTCPVCGRPAIPHPHRRNEWMCPKCEKAVAS